METNFPIRVGVRVYLIHAVAGEPGVVTSFDSRGRAMVFWPDMPELARETAHDPSALMVDESFRVTQLGLFEGQAA